MSLNLYSKIIVDLSCREYKVIDAVQYDTGRSINVTILNNGIPFNLTGLSVRAYSSNDYYKDLTIIAATSGQCNLKLDSKMLNKNNIDIQFRISDGRSIITSFAISLNVEKSLISSGAIQSSNEISSLDAALNKVQKWNDYFSDTLGELEKKYTGKLNEIGSRQYGGENLILDSGFLSGNVGTGFSWYIANSTTTANIVDSDSACSGKIMKITSTTGQCGVCQYIDTIRELKNSYTVSLKVYGIAGAEINVSLSYCQTKVYTIKKTNTWENVELTFSENVENWTKTITIFSRVATNFYIQDVALWEGKNAFSFKFNSTEPIFDNHVRISGKDVFQVNKSGDYVGGNCIHAPYQNTLFFYTIRVYHQNPKYKKVIAEDFNTSNLYISTCQNGVWKDWIDITQLKDLKQDSTHRTVTDEQIKAWNLSNSPAPAQNSYEQSPNRMIRQWGVTSVNITSGGFGTSLITFPKAFPNAILSGHANVNRNITNNNTDAIENVYANLAGMNKSGGKIIARDVVGSGENYTYEILWEAVGY